MQVGIFAKTFAGRDPQTVLMQVRAAGFAAAQFNLACAGLDPVPEVVPEGVSGSLRAAATACAVALPALSGTCNLAHPDRGVRQSGVTRLRGVIGCAAAAGIPMVTLCTGSRNAADQWAPHPDNTTPEAWADMRAAMAELAEMAEGAGVVLGIEPEQANVVRSVGDALRLAQDLGTDRLRLILDPANLFDHGSPAEVREIVARAVDEAAPMLGLAHAKDRTPEGRVVPPGDGAVDFPDFVRRLAAAGYDGALVTHGIAEAEVAQTARRLTAWLA